MRSRKSCRFQCLISRDTCFAENWKMSYFSGTDIAFCTNVILKLDIQKSTKTFVKEQTKHSRKAHIKCPPPARKNFLNIARVASSIFLKDTFEMVENTKKYYVDDMFGSLQNQGLACGLTMNLLCNSQPCSTGSRTKSPRTKSPWTKSP